MTHKKLFQDGTPTRFGLWRWWQPFSKCKLSAKYQFGAIDTADTTDATVANRALLSNESEKVHRLYLPVFAGD